MAMDDYDYVRGWQMADEAIKHRLPGHRNYSQGTTGWDQGWNARLAQQETLREPLTIPASDVQPGDVISVAGRTYRRRVVTAIPVSYSQYSPVRDKETVILTFSEGIPWEGRSDFLFDVWNRS